MNAEVADTEAPVANCQNLTVQLDANGQGSITAAAVNNNSTDNKGIVSMSVSPNSFNCDNTGDVTVVLTVSDEAGNSGTCTAIITVEDNLAPSLTTKNFAGSIDNNGNYIADVNDFVQSKSDACGIASLSLNNTVFSCSDIGTHTLQVSITDNNGNTTTKPATLTLSDQLAPNDISDLHVTDETVSSIGFSWTASPDNCEMQKYNIYRNGTLIGSVDYPATSFTDSGLAEKTTYNYTIKAVDASGNESEFSNTATGETMEADDIEAPTIPANLLTNNATYNSLGLIWEASTDNREMLKYNIYRNGTLIGSVDYPATSFTDSGLTEKTTYNYTIKAVDASGNESEFSNTATGETLEADDVEAPTAPNVAVSDILANSFTVTSSGSTDNKGVVETNFYLDENIDGIANGTLVHTSTANQPIAYNYTGLTSSTEYETYTQTTDAAGNISPVSNLEVVTTKTGVGIEEQEIAGFKAYPNPTTGHLTVQTDDTAIEQITISDIMGRQVFRENFDRAGEYLNIELNISNLKTGNYILNVLGEDGKRSTRKIVKK